MTEEKTIRLPCGKFVTVDEAVKLLMSGKYQTIESEQGTQLTPRGKVDEKSVLVCLTKGKAKATRTRTLHDEFNI